MSEDAQIQLAPLAEQAGGLDLVLIGASDPWAMRVHTQECAALGIPYAADPSQQLPRLEGAEVAGLVDAVAERVTAACGPGAADDIARHFG